MYRTKISYLLAGATSGILLVACDLEVFKTSTSVCKNDIQDKECVLKLQAEKLEIVRGTDLKFSVMVRDQQTDTRLIARVVQKPCEYEKQLDPKTQSQEYEIKLGRLDAPCQLKAGPFSLLVHQDPRPPIALQLNFKSPIQLKQSLEFKSSTISRDAQALISYIAFGKDTIWGLGSGTTLAGAAEARRARRFQISNTGSSVAISESPTTDYFTGPMTISALMSIAAERLYLSESTSPSMQEVFRCPAIVGAVNKAMCTSLMFPLLPNSKAMVVSPDESRMVLADAQGGLWMGLLPGPIQATGWNSLGMTGAGVRLAMTDLNGDRKPDIVAVWGATGSQQAAAYLATDAGYMQDTTVSKQLTTAIGSEAITALAAGDIDLDGYGDVVFAQKQKLVVLQSQLDKFEPVWSTTVDPEAGKTQIDAIAVGRLEPGIADDKQLDIVTASNSQYAMDNLTMYLHAFRPMP